MYDAVDVAAIPGDATLIGCYIDGAFVTCPAVAARFPGAQRVTITTQGTGAPDARVADCETGDLTPQTAATWAAREIFSGRRPTIYTSRSEWGEVQIALGAAGVQASAVDFWIADWTGQPHLVPGSVATQYASPDTGSGGNFDVSMTDGVWPGVPTPPPPPPQAQGADMLTSFIDPKDGSVHIAYLATNGHVIELFRGTPGVTAWHYGDLTQQTGSPVAAT